MCCSRTSAYIAIYRSVRKQNENNWSKWWFNFVILFQSSLSNSVSKFEFRTSTNVNYYLHFTLFVWVFNFFEKQTNEKIQNILIFFSFVLFVQMFCLPFRSTLPILLIWTTNKQFLSLYCFDRPAVCSTKSNLDRFDVCCCFHKTGLKSLTSLIVHLFSWTSSAIDETRSNFESNCQSRLFNYNENTHTADLWDNFVNCRTNEFTSLSNPDPKLRSYSCIQ